MQFLLSLAVWPYHTRCANHKNKIAKLQFLWYVVVAVKIETPLKEGFNVDKFKEDGSNIKQLWMQANLILQMLLIPNI